MGSEGENMNLQREIQDLQVALEEQKAQHEEYMEANKNAFQKAIEFQQKYKDKQSEIISMKADFENKMKKIEQENGEKLKVSDQDNKDKWKTRETMFEEELKAMEGTFEERLSKEHKAKTDLQEHVRKSYEDKFLELRTREEAILNTKIELEKKQNKIDIWEAKQRRNKEEDDKNAQFINIRTR